MSDTTAITIRLSADIDMAIELYVNEKGSLKEISEMTGVTVRMIMRTLRKKSIPLRMGEVVFEKGMEHARRVSRVLGEGG